MKGTDHSYIAIDGLIGTGKTHLTKLLANELKASAVYEEDLINPFLEQFYENPKNFALSTQLFFLFNRYRQLINISQTELFHSCTISDYSFPKNNIFASVTLSEQEISLYFNIVELMEDKVPIPDLIVFLQADISLLLSRIKNRGIPYERNITEDYLKLLNNAYNQHFFRVTGTPVMVLNVTDLDFNENTPDLKWLVDEINKPFVGIKYLNPQYK